MTTDQDDQPESRYVHRPGEEPSERETDPDFGWAGWVLVAVLVIALFIVPGAILLLPVAQGLIASIGLSLRDAYLTLPLIPAFLLGLVAVWAAVRSRSG